MLGSMIAFPSFKQIQPDTMDDHHTATIGIIDVFIYCPRIVTIDFPTQVTCDT